MKNKNDAADIGRKHFLIVPNGLIDHCADLNINSVQLHIILTIMRHAFQNDSAYPSIPTLQRKTGLSQPTIILSLRKLEEKGYVTKTQQFRDNKGQSNNLYSFRPLNNILDRLIKGENIQNILTPLKEINPPSKESLEPPLKEINPLIIHNKNNTNTNKTKSSSSTSSDDDILKKFNKYPPERVEAAMEVMRKRETAGQIIKNRTGYLRRMLENGFEDLVPASAPMRRPAEYKHSYSPPDSECTPLSEVLKNYFSLKN